jgi:hypothetical protein
MPDAVFVDELGNFHIKATVLGNLQETFLSPPLNRIDAISRFADSQGRLSDVAQFRLASRDLLDLQKQIQSSQLKREIEDGVSHQDLVIEIYDVEPNYQVCAKQLLNQIVDSLFRIDPILGQIRAIGDSERHSHIPFFFPTADIICGTLSFQIEVDNVCHKQVLRFGCWLLSKRDSKRGDQEDLDKTQSSKLKTQNWSGALVECARVESK